MTDPNGWRPIAEFTVEQQDKQGPMDLWGHAQSDSWCEHKCWWDADVQLWIQGDYTEIHEKVTHYRPHVMVAGPQVPRHD